MKLIRVKHDIDTVVYPKIHRIVVDNLYKKVERDVWDKIFNVLHRSCIVVIKTNLHNET